MIDDTATMLPSSVSNDRSLFAQIDPSASLTDSKIWNIASAALRWIGHLNEIPVKHIPYRIKRSGDHAIAFVQSTNNLEIPLAGNPDFHGHELRAAVADDEHAFDFIAALAWQQFNRR